MEMLKNLVLQTFTSAATSIVLLASIGWFFRTWIGERIRLKIKNEYDHRLEKLKAELKAESDSHLTAMKAELDRQADMLKIASTSFSEVQKATISKRIEAVDILWLGIVKFRKAFPSMASITDIFTDEEMKGFHTDPRMRKYSEELGKFNEVELVAVGSNEVVLVRPHLGEFIWALYATYNTILIRSIYLMKKSKEELGKQAWHLDPNIKNLIATAFGKDGLSEFENLRWGRYQWLSSQFDSSLFKAIDTLLSGKSFSDAALLQAQTMERQIYADKLNINV
ncbi:MULTISPECIES: hypothetical protein [Yersinia]|uniref:hypothetical protein n=1 Tax=Yersinia TaxID=629 RepID=UPI000B41DA78|nr:MULTISPECIES: hypothetical protein [Yersinia]OVZ73467.1 hypothetical protein CBW55_19680 [Yersinia intermedia]UYK11754.1 hypothetical protein N4226_07155 [Yersinia enterocolitica]HDL7971942.1 hypothetical protein [Yersinia enterocolitica]